MARFSLRKVSWGLAWLLPSVVLLSLAFAPVGQFYLAWVGLVPLLMFLTRCRSQRGAFFWSWIGGTIFFTVNMWWLFFVTAPGMIGLMVYCGLYWGFAALIIRGAKLLDRPAVFSAFVIPAVWVGCEWVRSNLFTGIPWSILGHTQTSILVMCQIADVTSAYGVSYWLVAVNVVVALAILRRRPILPAITAVVALLVVIGIYGAIRLQETADKVSLGPTVAVIQSNYPQSTDGSKGGTLPERVKFHKDITERAIAAAGGKIDLVAWSETMMPPINRESIAVGLGSNDNPPTTVADVRRDISELAGDERVNMIVGAEYQADWKPVDRKDERGQIEHDLVSMDKRNSAYFFDREGLMDDSLGERYDKVHLVPWGEYIPFRETAPWLYNLSLKLGPEEYTEYILQPGSMNKLTVFKLNTNHGQWRFVSPICFEDTDPRLSAAMFRPDSDGSKRADFLVNLTNDGWFKGNQNAQQLQSAQFRSIENRAPMARAVNTGISAFIDSTGKIAQRLPVRTANFADGQLWIDSRLTFYTRFGDVFAGVCAAVTVFIAVMAGLQKMIQRRKARV